MRVAAPTGRTTRAHSRRPVRIATSPCNTRVALAPDVPTVQHPSPSCITTERTSRCRADYLLVAMCNARGSGAAVTQECEAPRGFPSEGVTPVPHQGFSPGTVLAAPRDDGVTRVHRVRHKKRSDDGAWRVPNPPLRKKIMASDSPSAVRLAAHIGVSLLLAAPVGAQTSPATITVPRLPRAPALEYFDGQDSLAAERTAAGLGVAVKDFRQREPGDGTPVSQTTTAYLSYDDANLYVVFVCRDDSAKVRARIARREEIAADDQVVLYLDTFRDRERAYFFMTNPLGVQLDGTMTEGQDDDVSWDAVWQSDGQLTPDGYVVRMTIPFRSLRFPRASVQTWGVALARVIRRGNEEAYWPFITKRVQGLVPQFAELQGLANISPPRNIQVNPYGTVARARVLDKDAAARVTEGDQRAGFDAKMVLRDAITLDGTVNPDFSQVETDDPQVTVNQRFEVFFPEKRPFFIENSGYFQTPINLFFSRRIVDPGGGVRLTRKAGRWSLGAIAINDREPGRVPAPDPLAGSRANVGALRLQHELGEESTIGALVTDREMEGSYARVASLDNRLKLGRTWAATGQVMRSDVREVNGTASAGSGVLIDLERDGRNLDYSAQYLDLSPSFESQLGYVPRVGVREVVHQLQLVRRPDGPVVK